MQSTKSILIYDSQGTFPASFIKYFEDKEILVIVSKNLEISLESLKSGHFQLFYFILGDEQKQQLGQVVKEIVVHCPSCAKFMQLNMDISHNDWEALGADLKKAGIHQMYPENVNPHQVYQDFIGFKFGPTEVFKEREPEVSSSDIQPNRDYFPIKVKQYYADHYSKFDVFKKEESGRYLKILRAGEKFEQLELGREHDLKKELNLFIYKNDRLKFVSFCDQLAFKHFTKSKVDRKVKVAVMVDSLDAYLDTVFSEGLNEQSISMGKQICSRVFSLVQENPSYAILLKELEHMVVGAKRHSLVVTYLTAMISSGFEWYSTLSMETICLSSMFHDIGKVKLPKDLVAKKLILLSPSEREAYESHPRLSAEITCSHRSMNPTVSQIVLQHHEAVDGTGFPNHLTKNKILSMAQVVHLSDLLANLMVEKAISPLGAYKLLLADPLFITKFGRDVLMHFSDICAVSLDQIEKAG